MADNTGANGWRLAGKIALAVAVPLGAQLVAAGIWIGDVATTLRHYGEAIEALNERLDRSDAEREGIEARVRSLEISRGDGPWSLRPRPGSAP